MLTYFDHAGSVRRRRRLGALLLATLVLLTFLSCLPTHATAVPAIATSAKAYVLLDADSGQIIAQQNATVRLPMASTTKIMTALVALELLEPDTMVCIDGRAVGIEGSSIYLYEGEWLSVEQLLLGLLLESANDAAVALAIAACGSVEEFAGEMNRKALSLGLQDTHFENPHGLDAQTHYTTAYELGLITREALSNPTLRRIMSTRRATIPLCEMRSPDQEENPVSEDAQEAGCRVLLNHNKMLRYYQGAIGVKTGYTKRSGRCLVSAAERNGLTLIAVTLDAPDDWNDHTALLDYGFSRYSRVSLCEVGEYQTLLPISGGTQAYVMVGNAQNASVTLPTTHGAIRCRVELPRFLLAPVVTNKQLGSLIFLCDTDGDGVDEQIATLPLHTLYAVDAAPPPSLLTRIALFFQQLFSKHSP